MVSLNQTEIGLDHAERRTITNFGLISRIDVLLGVDQEAVVSLGRLLLRKRFHNLDHIFWYQEGIVAILATKEQIIRKLLL